MASGAELAMLIRAKDESGPGFASARGHVDGFGSAISRIGTAIGATLVTAAAAGLGAVVAGLGASVAAAAGFDETMASVRSKLSTEDWDRYGAALQDTAKRLGKDYPLSASEAGKAIDLLVQKGVSAKNINEGWADSVVQLSAATGSDLVTAAGIAAAASDAFGISADQSKETVNGVTAAVLKGGMSIEDYGFAMKASAAVVALAGGTIDDLNLALAAMARRGIEGSDAGTSYKTMMMNLIPTTKEQISVARELGLITKDGANKFFDASGKARDYASISKILAQAMVGLTKEQQLMKLETLFGSDAIRAAGIAADFGRGEIDELAASMRSVDAGDVTAKRLDNLKGSITSLTGSLETAGISIGQKFTSGLKTIVDGATEIVNQATPMLEGFAEGAAVGMVEAGRQVADSWRTAKQALAGEWAPSANIDPFVNRVGEAALKVKELGDNIQTASQKAGDLGAWENLRRAIENVKDTASDLPARIDRVSEAAGRLNTTTGGTSAKVDLLALGIKAFATNLELISLAIDKSINGVLRGAAAWLDYLSILANVGKGVVALATGDLPGLDRAFEGVKEGFVRLASAGLEQVNDLESGVRQGARAIGLNVEEGTTTAAVASAIHMAEVAKAVESNMAAANQAVSEGSSGMARFMEANGATMQAAAETSMAGVVGAVESQGPVAVTAAEAMGTGMAGGIEAAAPAMAAAAEAGASGAVAAVQAQQGPASSAGQAVGDSLGSGMESGILGRIGSVVSAAVQLVQSAIAAATGPQGADARSPSKKTEKLGKDLAEGLEVGLNKSNLGAEMVAKIRDFIAASREYIPTAGEIARVEQEIKTIREQGQTAALFRAERMITIDSEALRLKEAQVRLERDSIGLRQDLARATREVADIERGSLADRSRLIEMDGQRKTLRLQEIDLERQILGLDPDSKKAKRIKEQIDALRLQSRELDLESEKTRLTGDVAAVAARIKREALDDQARGQDSVIGLIKDQIDVLSAEKAVFEVNEAIIKNATDNEIAYRNRLIAVFTAEGKPLADRITAGKSLLEQLHKEGKISDELYNAVKKVTDQMGPASKAAADLGTSAKDAAPHLEVAATKADRMAREAADLARETAEAARKVDALSSSLGKLPDWFRPKGSGSIFEIRGRADGGPVSAGVPYLVGEEGPELIVPGMGGTVLPAPLTASYLGSAVGRGAGARARGGTVQEHVISLRVGDQEAGRIVAVGTDINLSIRGGS